MAKLHIDIGEHIRSLRHQLGLTQEKLARESGISRIAISMIETGRQRVSPGMAQRLAEALRISPQVLLHSQIDAPPSSDDSRSRKQIQIFRERQRIDPPRQRLTLDISPDFDGALADLCKQQSTSKAEIVRSALQSHFENIGYDSYFTHEDVGGQKLARRIRVRSVKQVMFHSRLLISAFDEALNYDARLHHNRPPPALRLDDKEYLEDIRRLVAELKKMNLFLANLSLSKPTKGTPPTQLRKHLDTFLTKYSATLGYGAGAMTLGLIATLLYQLGAGEIVFDHLLKKIPS